MFDNHASKSTKYRLIFTKFLPRILRLFGLALIKFKFFFAAQLNLHVVVFKIKQLLGARVRKKLIKRVRGYKPFSFRWWNFFFKHTAFFFNFDYTIEDDQDTNKFGRELSSSKFFTY